METALLQSVIKAIPDVEDLSKKNVDEFTAIFDKFFRWERQRILLQDPGEEEKAVHEDFVRFSLRLVKLILAIDNKNERLQMLKTRLDDSWLVFHNPITKEESDRILSEVFRVDSDYSALYPQSRVRGQNVDSGRVT